jgi:hypothetical protein
MQRTCLRLAPSHVLYAWSDCHLSVRYETAAIDYETLGDVETSIIDVCLIRDNGLGTRRTSMTDVLL